MVTESDRRDSACPRGISRRHFIKLGVAAGLMAGCAPAPQPAPTWTGEPDVTTGVATATDTPAPTSSPTATTTPGPTDTLAPTDTPAPTAIPVPTVHIRRPDIIQTYPDVPSKVVQAHHAGVWTGTPRGGKADNDLLVPEVLRQMLDTLIAELTGLRDGREAWAALFNPDERIAIKVNTLGFSGVAPFWTHAPLAMAVTECLQEAGVPAEQIFLYDITTSDLEGAGYSINRDGPGVRCYGTAESWRDRKKQGGRMYWDTNAFVRGWDLSGHEVGLSDILLHCDALINMPRLSDHSLSGITFAMKNHYGTFDSAAAFHVPETFRRAVVELNALPPIRDRTRLIVGDALVVVGWGEAVTGDSILVSFDPVATDTVALQLYLDAWPSGSEGLMPDSVVGRTTPWLENAARLGLGTNDPDHMDLVEVNLV